MYEDLCIPDWFGGGPAKTFEPVKFWIGGPPHRSLPQAAPLGKGPPAIGVKMIGTQASFRLGASGWGSLVVDLTIEFPPSRGITGRKCLCLPMLDYTAPNASQFAEVVNIVPEWEGGVYLHCAVRHGRSATLAAAVLVARGLAPDIDHAVAVLTAVRLLIKLNRTQCRLLDGLPANNAATVAGTKAAISDNPTAALPDAPMIPDATGAAEME